MKNLDKEQKEEKLFRDELGMIIKKGDVCLARNFFPRTSTFFYAKVNKLRYRKDGILEVTFYGKQGWYSSPVKLATK